MLRPCLHHRSLPTVLLSALVAAAFTGCADKDISRIETSYMVNLAQAREIDYKIAWQSIAPVATGGDVRRIHPYEDYIVVTETGMNTVSVLTARDGTLQWSYPVGDRLEHLVGTLRDGDEIIASTQSDVYVLDIVSGRLKSHQRYEAANLASTPPIVYGPMLIYGTLDGRVVYHHRALGLMRGAYRFDDAITHAPMLLNGEMAIFTQSGRINVMDVSANSRLWQARARDPIVARPVADERAIYVAGTDQSVWAFRRSDGRMIWRYRAEAPLTDNPTLVDGVLYQAVPGQGLVALDTATGRPKWISEEVGGGTVLTRRRGHLIVWHQDRGRGATGSTFYRVLERNGSVVGQMHTPHIWRAAADTFEDGNIYGVGRRGRIVRLVP